MTTLAVFLIAIGSADIVRRLTSRLVPSLAIGPVVVAACAALAGLWHGGDVVLLVVGAVACTAWAWLSARAERTGRHEGRP